MGFMVHTYFGRRLTCHMVISSQLFFGDDLTEHLLNVCNELTSDVKGIRHLFFKYK